MTDSLIVCYAVGRGGHVVPVEQVSVSQRYCGDIGAFDLPRREREPENAACGYRSTPPATSRLRSVLSSEFRTMPVGRPIRRRTSSRRGRTFPT